MPADAGGGSVSEQGVRDLALVAYQFGLHAAPGPLLGSNVVAAAIGRWGSREQQAGPLRRVAAAATRRAAWALAEAPPNDALGQVELRGHRVDRTVSSSKGSSPPSRAELTPSYFLVTARSGPGLSQFLVPAGSPGLRHRPSAQPRHDEAIRPARVRPCRVPAVIADRRGGRRGRRGGVAHRPGGHGAGRRDVRRDAAGRSTPPWSGRSPGTPSAARWPPTRRSSTDSPT